LLFLKEAKVQEVIASVANAISLTKRLKEISDNIRDAEFKNVLADLSIELAETKLKVAELLSENAELKNQLQSINTSPADPCSRCRKRTYTVSKSEPDKEFGDLGGLRRTYLCSACGFTEDKIET
jgi:ribosomal protein L37E